MVRTEENFPFYQREAREFVLSGDGNESSNYKVKNERTGQLEPVWQYQYLEAGDEFAGYVTLKWQSQYPSFKEQRILEIMDLNVLPGFRKMGVGSLLLDTAEKEAATRNKVVGIGVGLYAGEDGGYGAAQRLYVKRGYNPDGKGVTYNYQPTIPGNSYPLDDDLVLWFTKKLR